VCPSIDLVLLSHGDLAHTGLFPYAHAHWGLRAPVYSSIPVQSLGKVAVSEEAESLRGEEDVDAGKAAAASPSPATDSTEEQTPPPNPKGWNGKRIATVKEVQAAFESINTLRYSQPTRLSGLF
jgi:cleavage and polyadenylation specificity factor subunit 2